jgi:EAL domain-containing protein (putative c-di-GMP-specific phosphodiesterase class I)/CheY-like chemotaxis protein
MNTNPIESSLRVLVVDDQEQIRLMLDRTLSRAGYVVTTEADVPAACARLQSDPFDVVLTDLQLPSGSGLDVLAAVHRLDPGLPVVFVTGAGDLASAERALGQGALRYLVKPVRVAGLLTAIAEACRARAATRGARARSDGSHPNAVVRACDTDLQRVILARNFDVALDRLWMAMQPVAALSRRQVVAYEALVRSDEPTLARPDLLIAAAEDLGRLPELGQRIRAACAQLVSGLDVGVDLLVNLHPNDLHDGDLFDPSAPLSIVAPRVILEITERASLDELKDLQERIASLRRLGFRIAIDDLGAGYGSLSAMALLRPELVKLDMSLIRDVGNDPVRTRMIRSIGALCEQLGIPWLCEGVETMDELRALIAVGADLMQGYLFAKPSRELGGVSDAVYDAAPRRERDTRRPHDGSLGPLAQGLCRDAIRLSESASPELRLVLGELREVVDLLID